MMSDLSFTCLQRDRGTEASLCRAGAVSAGRGEAGGVVSFKVRGGGGRGVAVKQK